MQSKRYEVAVGARLAADTIQAYDGGRAYRATMIDETTIEVELLDSAIDHEPADRIVDEVRGDAGTPADWLDDHDAA
jgi:hypothetical protein